MVEQAVHCPTPKGTAYLAYDQDGAPPGTEQHLAAAT